MSYTPTTWQTGDTITAAGLNKIEQGIANAGGDYGYDVVITASDKAWNSSTTLTLTKGTASAVWDKLSNGEYVRALIICDCSFYTFPTIYTYDSFAAFQTSTEGTVCFRFFDNYDSAQRYIYIESDGTIWF